MSTTVFAFISSDAAGMHVCANIHIRFIIIHTFAPSAFKHPVYMRLSP